MKVNLNVAFKDAFLKEVKEDGKAVMMRDQIASLLFAGMFLERTGNASTDNSNKMSAYRLSLKVAAGNDEIEINTEEAVMIKQAASMLQAGVYGQICDLIEGANNKKK
ncbi:MAG: hypothetical protein PHG27_09825 [Massilibacteroides sp.]|nr:hypothetical protein [Massilibacteroides sp.]